MKLGLCLWDGFTRREGEEGDETKGRGEGRGEGRRGEGRERDAGERGEGEGWEKVKRKISG